MNFSEMPGSGCSNCEVRVRQPPPISSAEAQLSAQCLHLDFLTSLNYDEKEKLELRLQFAKYYPLIVVGLDISKNCKSYMVQNHQTFVPGEIQILSIKT